MYIIMDETIAKQITGDYGTCHSIEPIKLINGKYALPASILTNEEFSSIYDILNACEIVNEIEVCNETE